MARGLFSLFSSVQFISLVQKEGTLILNWKKTKRFSLEEITRWCFRKQIAHTTQVKKSRRPCCGIRRIKWATYSPPIIFELQSNKSSISNCNFPLFVDNRCYQQRPRSSNFPRYRCSLFFHSLILIFAAAQGVPLYWYTYVYEVTKGKSCQFYHWFFMPSWLKYSTFRRHCSVFLRARWLRINDVTS